MQFFVPFPDFGEQLCVEVLFHIHRLSLPWRVLDLVSVRLGGDVLGVLSQTLRGHFAHFAPVPTIPGEEEGWHISLVLAMLISLVLAMLSNVC